MEKLITADRILIRNRETEILNLSQQKEEGFIMYEFWYDYVKPEYGRKAKLFYINTDSFIVYIKIDDNYKDIAEGVETRFDTSNYELQKRLPIGKSKKVFRLIIDELGGKIMTKFAGLRAKTYSYLLDDGSEDKKEKDTKKPVIKKTCI